jgi:hypothetical protein
MDLELVPTLFAQLRETVEGPPKDGWCWITDGKPGSELFGTLNTLTPQQAFAPPVAGAKSIAAHVEHLRFTFAVTVERLAGKDPRPDWAGSFVIAETSPAAWEIQKRELRRAYDAMIAGFEKFRDQPIQEWPPIVAAGMVAQIGHTAYHLAAIRQIAQIVRRVS